MVASVYGFKCKYGFITVLDFDLWNTFKSQRLNILLCTTCASKHVMFFFLQLKYAHIAINYLAWRNKDNACRVSSLPAFERYKIQPYFKYFVFKWIKKSEILFVATKYVDTPVKTNTANTLSASTNHIPHSNQCITSCWFAYGKFYTFTVSPEIVVEITHWSF